jgi:hypothetical protein
MTQKHYPRTPHDMYGLNYSKQYFKNLKDFLEAQQSKASSVLYRKKLREHQDKVNYTNEIQRLRGELSKNDTRLPIGTRERLETRVKRLIELGGDITDGIK